MNEKSFETLILPAEWYKDIFEFSVKIILIFIVIMLVSTYLSHRNKAKIHIPIMWYINVPKMVISFMAVLMVFCYDYNTKSIQFPKFDNMLMSTFLVGILAVIELLSCLASMIKDVCDMFNND